MQTGRRMQSFAGQRYLPRTFFGSAGDFKLAPDAVHNYRHATKPESLGPVAKITEGPYMVPKTGKRDSRWVGMGIATIGVGRDEGMESPNA